MGVVHKNPQTRGEMGLWIQTFPHSERGFAAASLTAWVNVQRYLMLVLLGYLWVLPSFAVLGRTIRAFCCVVNTTVLNEMDALPSLANQENQTREGVDVKQVEGRWLGRSVRVWECGMDHVVETKKVRVKMRQ